MIFTVLFVASVWSTFLIIAVILAKYIGSDQWFRVYDNCYTNDLCYQFLFRMIHSRLRDGFDPQSAKITVQLIDNNDIVSSEFSIPPKAMSSSTTTTKGDKMVRIVIYRKRPIRSVAKVVINHNSNGKIFIATAEVQNSGNSRAAVAFVKKYISCLSGSRARVEQCFATAVQVRPIDSRPNSPFALDFYDYTAFVWMSINFVMLLSVSLIFCSPKRAKKIVCSSYKSDPISSLLTGLSSSALTFLVFAVLIIIHRFVVKEHLMRFRHFLSTLYVSLVVILGLVAGIGAPLMSYQFRHKSNDLLFWIFSVFIGIILLIIFWLPLGAAIARLIGFFDDPAIDYIREDIEFSRENSIKEKTNLSKKTVMVTNAQKSETMKTVKNQNPKTRIETPQSLSASETSDKRESEESLGNRYYEQLMKGRSKIKSISKY